MATVANRMRVFTNFIDGRTSLCRTVGMLLVGAWRKDATLAEPTAFVVEVGMTRSATGIAGGGELAALLAVQEAILIVGPRRLPR
jgi:hypothetical protein